MSRHNQAFFLLKYTYTNVIGQNVLNFDNQKQTNTIGTPKT